MNDAYFSAFYSLTHTFRWEILLKQTKLQILIRVFILACMLGYVQNSQASNYFFEFETSEALKQKIPAKEFVWLETGGQQKTLSLLVKSQSLKAKGAVIILPDIGHHPDWSNVIHDLRYYLPEYGWATLSVQPPVDVNLISKQDFENVYQTIKRRIAAAIKYIQLSSPDYIVLLGKGKSANFAIRYMAEAQKGEQVANALIFISAFDDAHLDASAYMKSIAIPMLDIFAERDHVVVLESARKRVVAAKFAAKLKNTPQNLTSSLKVQQLALKKSGNLRYRQIVLPGANLFFHAQSTALLKAMRGWLKVHSFKKNVMAQF